MEFPTGALQVALATPVDTAKPNPTTLKYDKYVFRLTILGPSSCLPGAGALCL
jgi:hypothetical protein